MVLMHSVWQCIEYTTVIRTNLSGIRTWKLVYTGN